MRQIVSIDLSEAERLADAAMARARSEGIAVHIAVCDAAGALIHYRRMDGANGVSGEIAMAKAFTSAGTGAATADLGARTVPGEPGWGLQHMCGGRLTSLGGGLPIRVDGKLAGAIGVSGGSVAQDIDVAKAALLEPVAQSSG